MSQESNRRTVSVYLDFDTFSLLEEAVRLEEERAMRTGILRGMRSRSKIADACIKRGLEVELGRAALMQCGDGESLSPIVSRDPNTVDAIQQKRRTRTRADTAREQWEKQKREVRRLTNQRARIIAVTPSDGTRTMVAELRIQALTDRINDAIARAKTARDRLESYVGPVTDEEIVDVAVQAPLAEITTRVEVREELDTGPGEVLATPAPLPWEVAK